jgi:hypothetical protein
VSHETKEEGIDLKAWMVRAVAPTASLVASGERPYARRGLQPGMVAGRPGPGRASTRDDHDDPVQRNPQRVLDGELSGFPAGLDREIVISNRSSNLAPCE